MSNIVVDNLNVRMDKANQRFYFEEKEAKDAQIEYKLLEDGTLEFTHTFVPEALREMGIGELLAEGAFKFLMDNDRKAKISCPFIQKFVDKRPSFKEYIVK